MSVYLEHIARLIFKRFIEPLTAEEQQTFDQWLNENEEHRVFMNGLENEGELIRHMKQVQRDKENNTEALLYERITSRIAFNNELNNGRIVHRVHFLKTAWFRYAAAMIILIAGVATYYLINEEPRKETPAIIAKTEDILPGSDKAILTLSDGKKIELNNATSETINDGQLSIKNNSGQLTYLPIPSNGGVAPGAGMPHGKNYDPGAGVGSGEAMYNTMSTPIGGQYKLTLSDGTKVWLNAASSITYPTAFTENTRRVSITGEAYLEVTTNKSKPFIVKTNKQEIIVLGTEFNVNSYADEPLSKTSLITGSIKIDNKVLKPGQAFTNGKIIQTNIARDIAWKNGYFSFEDADIQTVMRQISRWYNVNVIYRGEVSKTEINGEIGRTLTLTQVLKVLKNLRINYTVEKNTIIIHP